MTLTGFDGNVSVPVNSKEERMIKSDLVERVMEAADLPKPKATDAVNALFEGMKDALLRGDRIELNGHCPRRSVMKKTMM